MEKEHPSNSRSGLKVLYLMCMERILDYGIFDSQVKNLLKEMSRRYKTQISITLMAMIPLIHVSRSGVSIIPIRYRREIRHLKRELSIHRIRLSILFVPIPRWSIYLKIYFFPVFILTSLPMIILHLWRNNYDIIHCRSYLPALVSALSKKSLSKATILFDTRAPVPEQGVIAGHYRRESMSFRVWKKIEEVAIKHSDSVVFVTEQFAEEMKKRYKVSDYCVIHNTVVVEKYVRDNVKIAAMKKKYNLSDKVIVVYNGSLGVWNDPEILSAVFRKLGEVNRNMFLLVLTTYSHEKLQTALEKSRIAAGSYRIMTLKPEKVSDVLSIGDYGLWPSVGLYENDPVERMHRTVTGIKTFEYLAAGLPIIANANMEGVKYIVEKYDTGITFDIDNPDKMVHDFENMEGRYDEIQKNCISTARRLGDVSNHARKYFKLYKRMKGVE